ncbi:MAG: ruvA [Anaerocolumna sp.]|jgi:Holliday junction DNA helicase RuvA|nr:ruvA [Anaerocolumna sp.]
MLSYIKGELTEVSEEGIVVETNGIGYEVRMPLSSLNELPRLGSDIKVYTYMHVREDFIGLFGFLTKDDLTIFKLLITVNGIGPKGALGILSAITPDDLRFAVLSDDAKTIAKAPGIGSKTASKLIIELKDKLKLEDAFEQKLSNQMDGQMQLHNTGISITDIRNEAIQALVVLGYSSTDAAKVVRKIDIKEGMSSEDVLKISLKSLM